MFYHDQKEHMSPSAHDSWHRSRAAFIRSYFEGEKTAETTAMRFGTQVHALIEAGLLHVQKQFDKNEITLVHEVPMSTYKYLGRPDSFQGKPKKNTVEFVDYKTGKKSEWDDKLTTDIKMLGTAWLVWVETGKPQAVIGHIEFLQTEWNEEKRELELVDKPTELSSRTYHYDELEAFGDVIRNDMSAVNAFYEKWLTKSDEFIDKDDCAELARIEAQIEELDAKAKSLRESIKAQMEFGGLNSYKLPGVGTFSMSTRKSYTYPPSLRINYLDYGLVLEDYLEIEKAVKSAKKNFELASEPTSESVTFSFRKG